MDSIGDHPTTLRLWASDQPRLERSGWVMYKDKNTKRAYFHHAETSRSSWTVNPLFSTHVYKSQSEKFQKLRAAITSERVKDSQIIIFGSEEATALHDQLRDVKHEDGEQTSVLLVTKDLSEVDRQWKLGLMTKSSSAIMVVDDVRSLRYEGNFSQMRNITCVIHYHVPGHYAEYRARTKLIMNASNLRVRTVHTFLEHRRESGKASFVIKRLKKMKEPIPQELLDMVTFEEGEKVEWRNISNGGEKIYKVVVDKIVDEYVIRVKWKSSDKLYTYRDIKKQYIHKV